MSQNAILRILCRGALVAAIITLPQIKKPLLAQQAPAPAQQGAAGAPSGAKLSISMEQAVAMALDSSLDLKSERLNVDIADQSIVSARASFLPSIQSGISRNSSESQPQRFSDGTVSVSSSSNVSGNALFRQVLPWYGGSYQARWTAGRTAYNGSAGTYNPSLGSTFSMDFTQPLWEGFKIDSSRANLERSERLRSIADVQLQQQILATEHAVRLAYLNLVAAIEGQKVAQQNMDLSEQSLRNARARVQVGQSPQIEIVTAEASVETNRDSLIQAGARISTAEDSLRSLILDPERPDYWSVSLDPTEAPRMTPRQVDVDAAIKNALDNRLDLIVLKRQVEITNLNIDLSRNLTKPSVDMTLNYSSSGSGGTQLSDSQLTRGFGSVLTDAFGAQYPNWTLGVTVAYPLGQSAQKASLAQGELQRRQQGLAVRQLELQIVGAVREAARDVQTSFQRVQATQAARIASQRQLEAEERKFSVGMSDTYATQQKQRDLANALTGELNAIISYNLALIELDRVQKIR